MEEMELDLEEPDDATPTAGNSKAQSAENSKITVTGSNKNASKGLDGELDFPLSQATTAGGDKIGISIQNILKGVLMINRFLSCNPKITPFVRQFYELYAVSHFTVLLYTK
jgi:hypothetical protein